MMDKLWNYNEFLSQERLVELQELKLNELIERLKGNVSFYREALANKSDGHISLRDIVHLPFTTKQDLRNNYPLGFLAAPMSHVVRLHGSSGTTGNQTFVAYTKNDLDIWSTLVARSLTAIGVSNEDIMQISFGYGLFTGGLGIHGGAEKIGATVIPSSSGATHKQLMLLKDLNTTVLCCTPSYGLYLSDAARELGISVDDLNLKIGLFGAEPWSNEVKNELEKGLGIKAFDIYGLSEIMGPGVAYSCEAQDGLHLNEDHFIAEIINPETGNVLPMGETGELVITTLSKEAFPLLRYRTGDITSLITKRCECGRTFIRMAKPTGRVDDMLIVRGINIFPSQIESLLLATEGCSPFYELNLSVHNRLDLLTVKVESHLRNKEELVKLKMKLENKLKQELGLSIPVELVAEKALKRFEGKACRVNDNR